MKTLAVIKPVSIKLQKKSNDIVKAYNMIAEMEKRIGANGKWETMPTLYLRNGMKMQ